MNTRDQIWDMMIECGIATQEELELVTCINGYTIETLDDIYFARTGYRDSKDLLDEEVE
jgi:hypothetical protein